MTKSESLAKLAPALLKAQKTMEAALKDSKNPFFKSKYADLNAIIDAAIPALNNSDIVVLQTPQIVDGKPVIQTMLLHTSGEFIVSNTEVVASKVNDPQAAGSAITYARRYGLQATVTLKAEDDDGERAMGRNSATITTATQSALSKVETKSDKTPPQKDVETKPAVAGKGFTRTKPTAATADKKSTKTSNGSKEDLF